MCSGHWHLQEGFHSHPWQYHLLPRYQIRSSCSHWQLRISRYYFSTSTRRSSSHILRVWELFRSGSWCCRGWLSTFSNHLLRHLYGYNSYLCMDVFPLSRILHFHLFAAWRSCKRHHLLQPCNHPRTWYLRSCEQVLEPKQDLLLRRHWCIGWQRLSMWCLHHWYWCIVAIR